MSYNIQHPSDCDNVVKLGNAELSCYSKKQMKVMHPNKDFTVVGGASRLYDPERGSRGKNGKMGTKTPYSDGVALEVLPHKPYDFLLYRRAGYLSLGGGRYIAIKKPIWPFYIPVAAAILCVIILALIMWLGGLNGPKPIEPLPPIHEELHPMPGGDAVAGEGSVSMTYVLKAKTSLSTGEVGVYFANPAASNQNVVVELHLVGGEEDIVLATSGLIPRGNSISKMEADKKALSRLSVGDYNGYYRVICYDHETEERSLVEPKITDVVITVIK